MGSDGEWREGGEGGEGEEGGRSVGTVATMSRYCCRYSDTLSRPRVNAQVEWVDVCVSCR